jgi:hypothetical protein
VGAAPFEFKGAVFDFVISLSISSGNQVDESQKTRTPITLTQKKKRHVIPNPLHSPGG